MILCSAAKPLLHSCARCRSRAFRIRELSLRGITRLVDPDGNTTLNRPPYLDRTTYVRTKIRIVHFRNDRYRSAKMAGARRWSAAYMRAGPRTHGAKVVIGDAAPLSPIIPAENPLLIVGVRNVNYNEVFAAQRSGRGRVSCRNGIFDCHVTLLSRTPQKRDLSPTVLFHRRILRPAAEETERVVSSVPANPARSPGLYPKG